MSLNSLSQPNTSASLVSACIVPLRVTSAYWLSILPVSDSGSRTVVTLRTFLSDYLGVCSFSSWTCTDCNILSPILIMYDTGELRFSTVYGPAKLSVASICSRLSKVNLVSFLELPDFCTLVPCLFPRIRSGTHVSYSQISEPLHPFTILYHPLF